MLCASARDFPLAGRADVCEPGTEHSAHAQSSDCANGSVHTSAGEIDAAEALCCIGSMDTPSEAPQSLTAACSAGRDGTATPLTVPATPRRALSSSMAIVEAKHARWQAHLQQALDECTCEVTRCLLHPATCLDPLSTALHLTRLQPREMVLLSPALRKLVARFQRRAQHLGLVDILPKLARSKLTRGRLVPRGAAHQVQQPV